MEFRSLKPFAAVLVLAILFCQGCVHGITTHSSSIMKNVIPAHRLPPALSSMSKDNLVPIDMTRLRRDPVKEHLIGPHDVLGVYIETVLAVENQLPAVFYPADPESPIRSPSVGHPVRVQADGTISLPLAGRINVAGLTIGEAVAAISRPYVEGEFLKEGRGLVTVDLIRPRSVKVFVVREDTGPPGGPSLIRPDTHVLAKRGTADALELPIYENDLLHALSATGGLPGVDGFNEVWILRGTNVTAERRAELMSRLQAGEVPQEELAGNSEFVRIPLRLCPGQPIPFSPEDIILHDGDVVFIEARDLEYFTVGGLIDGGIFPLPRNRDVDILEAIATANSNVMGPAGNTQGFATNFRSGPGNIVAPSDALVIRRLPNGEQIKILVDLRIAMTDANERINVMPRDMIILRYKPSELVTNIAINLVNFNFLLNNSNN